MDGFLALFGILKEGLSLVALRIVLDTDAEYVPEGHHVVSCGDHFGKSEITAAPILHELEILTQSQAEAFLHICPVVFHRILVATVSFDVLWVVFSCEGQESYINELPPKGLHQFVKWLQMILGQSKIVGVSFCSIDFLGLLIVTQMIR